MLLGGFVLSLVVSCDQGSLSYWVELGLPELGRELEPASKIRDAAEWDVVLFKTEHRVAGRLNRKTE